MVYCNNGCIRFFPTEENFFIGICFVTLTAAFICFPTISLWALFGSGLRAFANKEKQKDNRIYSCIIVNLAGIFILIKYLDFTPSSNIRPYNALHKKMQLKKEQT